MAKTAIMLESTSTGYGTLETDRMTTSKLIGLSPTFVAVLEEVEIVAATDCTVLIQGETGTGKELIAQAIHQTSARRHHRCVAINCSAIPAALLESEMFG